MKHNFKLAWAVKPKNEDRICVNRMSFGNYSIFPSRESATALCLDLQAGTARTISDDGIIKYDVEYEVVEIELKQNG